MSKSYVDYFVPQTTSEEKKEAFMDGYIAALKVNRVYDPALFLNGAKLELQILGTLIAQESRTEDSARSKARIINTKLGIVNSEAYRDILSSSESGYDGDNNSPAHTTK